jgi:hypothetical protein
MNPTDEPIQKFFEDYETAIRTSDPVLMAALYAESFTFAGPQGAQAVKKEDFLKVLPRREGFFKALGLKSTTLRSLEETRLDEAYRLVRVVWTMRFEKEPGKPLFDDNSATYVLVLRDQSAQIVFQLDHQDLMKRAQELGLVPAED